MSNLDQRKNLFDEDDTLDYIIYKEMEKGSQKRNNRKAGCLPVIIAVLVPAGAWLLCSQWIVQESLR